MPQYTFEIAGLDNTILADISALAFGKQISPRLNKAGSSQFRIPLNSDDAQLILEPDAGDGYPTLHEGNRRLIVKKEGAPVANDYLWTIERRGGRISAWADVTAWGPMIRWQTRWAQDADGSIVDGTEDDLDDPDFGKPILDLPAGAVDDDALTVSGGDLLRQMIENTIANDGPVGVTTAGGTFDTAVPPAADVSFALTNWPTRIGDLAAVLFATGVVDVELAPTAAIGDAMAVLSAVTMAGTDRPGISFDWGAGANNCSDVRHVGSMDEFANRIRYFLGPRLEPNRWRGSIDATTAGITTDPADSRDAYGVYVDYPIFDSRDNENALREFYKRLFDRELAYRMVPRQLIHFTPQAGLAAEPFADYGLGDTARGNIGAGLGLTLTDAVIRIFGMDISISPTGVERVGELITMADA